MTRPSHDVTEAELTLLRELWGGGPATIRLLAERVYGEGGASAYATVQKLLERLESKGFVERERGGHPQTFRAAVGRDELIRRRLRTLADTLCGGSIAPLLTNLVRKEGLSESELQELREIVNDLGPKAD